MNKTFKKILSIALAIIFVFGSILFTGLFSISPLTGKAWLITIGLMLCAVPIMILLTQLSYLMGVKRPPALFKRRGKESNS